MAGRDRLGSRVDERGRVWGRSQRALFAHDVKPCVSRSEGRQSRCWRAAQSGCGLSVLVDAPADWRAQLEAVGILVVEDRVTPSQLRRRRSLAKFLKEDARRKLRL